MPHFSPMSDNHAGLFASAVPGNGSSNTLGENGATPEGNFDVLQRLEASDSMPPELKTSGDAQPVLLKRLDMLEEITPMPIAGTLLNAILREYEAPSRMNALTTWTKSSRVSDPMKSLSSKHCRTSYQSSTSIRPELNERKTQRSNTMQRPLMKFKPRFFSDSERRNCRRWVTT